MRREIPPKVVKTDDLRRISNMILGFSDQLETSVVSLGTLGLRGRDDSLDLVKNERMSLITAVLHLRVLHVGHYSLLWWM